MKYSPALTMMLKYKHVGQHSVRHQPQNEKKTEDEEGRNKSCVNVVLLNCAVSALSNLQRDQPTDEEEEDESTVIFYYFSFEVTIVGTESVFVSSFGFRSH